MVKIVASYDDHKLKYMGRFTMTCKLVTVQIKRREESLVSGQLYRNLCHIDTNPRTQQNFARTFWQGVDGMWDVLLMQPEAGFTLRDTIVACRQVNAQTCAVAAEQAIRCLSYIHAKNLVHAYVTSDSFVWGVGDQVHHLHLLDFDLGDWYW